MLETIANRYEYFRERAKNICKGDCDPDELLHRICEKIADYPKEKQAEIIEKGYDTYWIIRVMYNECIDKNSVFNKQTAGYRSTVSLNGTDETLNWNYTYTPLDIESEIKFEQDLQKIESKFCNLTSFEHKAMSIYYYSNHYQPENLKPKGTVKQSIRHIAKETSVSASTIWKGLESARDKLKHGKE